VSDVALAVQNSNHAQPARIVEVVDPNHVESSHWPGPKARDRTSKHGSDVWMLLKLFYALDHSFAEAHRNRRRILIDKILAELANDVGFGTRKKFNFHRRRFRVW
jgi:hypothetical protein